MQMFEYLVNHHDKLLYLLAGISLVIELGVMGMSGPLLFFAIACVVTGVLITAGVLTSWQMEVLTLGLVSVLSSLLLWKPLKQLQGSGKVRDTSSDLIGRLVPVSQELTPISGKIRYSGIDWQARLDEQLGLERVEVGEQVRIVAVDGTVLIVEPKQP